MSLSESRNLSELFGKKWDARHSAGSIVAVNSYFEAPERVAALILVAPAILAPLSVCKVAKGNRLLKVEGNQLGRDDQIQEGSSNSNIHENPFIRVCKILSKFSKYIVRAIAQMMKRTANMLNSLYKKALSAILRSAFAVMLVKNFFLNGSIIRFELFPISVSVHTIKISINLYHSWEISNNCCKFWPHTL